MKNNILLILAVTIISIGIIVATVVISTAGGSENSSEDSSSRSSGSSSVSKSTTEGTSETDPPEVTDETSDSTAPEIVETTTTERVETSTLPEESSQPSEIGDAIIATAKSLIGIDFMDGGDTPEYGFDNSGFVYYVLRENGYITCPRGLTAQTDMGTAITYEELRPGDLVYFYAEDMVSVGFGGIYRGDGVMIACLMPGTQVKEVNITNPYYSRHFYRGVSIA